MLTLHEADEQPRVKLSSIMRILPAWLLAAYAKVPKARGGGDDEKASPQFVGPATWIGSRAGIA